MNYDTLKIRRLQFEDIEDAMKLVLAEGWNQTERDWQLFIGNPQNICLKAEIHDKLVATATAINYANRLVWIGMVLVNNAHRGKGIATMLMTTLLKESKSIQSVKLDATFAGQQVYQKIGFAGEYKIYRMVNPSFNIDLISDSEIISMRISEQNFSEIIEFDKNAFGVHREGLLSYLLIDFPQLAWVAKKNNNVLGFALGRKGNKYFLRKI